MAAVLSQQLRRKAQSPPSLISISRRLYSNLHPHAHLKPRPSTILASSLPTRSGLFNRSFMVSTSSYEQSGSDDMLWDDLSNERKLQQILDPGEKWGWVIYRCSYKPELENAWKNFKDWVDKNTRKEIAKSDAPDVADKLDWVFVEDPELEGVSLDELKRRFRAWTRSEVQGRYNIDIIDFNRGARYTYFIQVDEDALLSLLRGPIIGYVNIVRGWEDPLPPEEATDQFGETVDIEDWMKIQAGRIGLNLYMDLDEEEFWYVIYSPPRGGWPLI